MSNEVIDWVSGQEQRISVKLALRELLSSCSFRYKSLNHRIVKVAGRLSEKGVKF